MQQTPQKKIFLTTGAADPYNAAGSIIDAILSESKLNEYRIVVVKGRFWDDHNISKYISEHQNRLRIYENVENMADLMFQSTVEVSAGGSTLYELCACCVPTVTISYADNQFGDVKGFDNRGLMDYAGDVRNTNEIGTEVTKRLLTYHDNNDIIQDKVTRMRNLNCRTSARGLAEILSLDD